MTSSRASRRKALKPTETMFKQPGSVEPLRVEDMVIHSGYGKLYLKRLKYRGCPKLSNGNFGRSLPQFPQGVELIDAGRDDFIRECYQILKSGNTNSTLTYFRSLILYLVWVDDSGSAIPKDGYLAWTLIEAYLDWCAQQHKLGRIKFSNYQSRKLGVSWFLRQSNRPQEAKKLPSIRRFEAGAEQNATLDLESELKPTAKALFKSYSALLDHFKQGTVPSKHPLYDESLIEQEASKKGIAGRKLGGRKVAFIHAIGSRHRYNPIVDVAMMLTYMFTGMNANPLSDLMHSDVSFRKVQGGKYILNSVKGRANYQEQDNAIGFSKHAKRFIESWLEVSKEIASGDDSYLFPYFTVDGRVISYSQTGKTPHTGINKLLGHLGLTKVTPSRFRKARSNALFRVTESVYLVAISNNNSMEITARTYAHGTEKEHTSNLSAAMSAKFDIARGKEVATAVEEAKHHHGDILDDYEYQSLRKGQDRSHEARTPTGIRCKDNRQGAASIIKKSLKRVGIDTNEGEAACTDFLACFDCAQHALVTDVDDIWLMLSFKDTLQQLQQTPAINSMPERKYADLFNLVESVLNGFKAKNETNYKLALEKLKDAPHPLYSTIYSLNDLLETFS
ncbi:hypothetical protein [Marisediminitalea sp.]|uniref:hypothetical protein n=1 Tax=Marisediminitalea sp. TaxID=2662268 RepID=UPI00351912BD